MSIVMGLDRKFNGPHHVCVLEPIEGPGIGGVFSLREARRQHLDFNRYRLAIVPLNEAKPPRIFDIHRPETW